MRPPKPPSEEPKVEGTLLGEVEDYFAKIGVVAMTLKVPLSVGETIRIKGHTTDVTQRVDSMQIERQSVTQAEKGKVVGIKVKEKVREHDQVFRV